MLSENSSLKKIKYPYEKTENNLHQNENDDAVKTDDINSWSTLVEYQIPKDLAINKELAKIMYFDFESKKWCDKYISDVQIITGIFFNN